MYKCKPFESRLKDKYDFSSKQAVAQCLESTGLYRLAVPTEEQGEFFKARDFSMVRTSDDSQVAIECECKAVWTKTGEWQYGQSGLHIPYRKCNSKADLFAVVNANYDSMFVLSASTLFASKVITKCTTNKVTGTRTFGEKFFEVSLAPESGVYFYVKTDDAWLKKDLPITQESHDQK